MQVGALFHTNGPNEVWRKGGDHLIVTLPFCGTQN